MSKKSTKGDWSTRTIKTPEGIQVTFFDNKLHNWNGPAIKYPRDLRQNHNIGYMALKKLEMNGLKLEEIEMVFHQTKIHK